MSVFYPIVSTELRILTVFSCHVSRSVIEKPFFRYHDLQAGKIVEVRIKHHLLFKYSCREWTQASSENLYDAV